VDRRETISALRNVAQIVRMAAESGMFTVAGTHHLENAVKEIVLAVDEYELVAYAKTGELKPRHPRLVFPQTIDDDKIS
jgi:hypothetical protein